MAVVVMALIVTVMVVVTPAATSSDVVYGAIEIVVGAARAKGGSTNWQGGVHCAGVPE